MKRILLFLVTNLAVVFVLSIVMRILGIDQYIAAQGGSAYGLLVFAAVFGFGGAIISLLISKWSAQLASGAHEFLHTPARHTRLAAQAMPQPPQWSTVALVSVSQPLAAAPSQLP